MMRNLYLLVFTLGGFWNHHLVAQELLASVTVDYSQIQTTNPTSFKLMEEAIGQFINTTQWTDKTYDIHQRIQCAFYFILDSKTNGQNYSGKLVVQARRPIYKSTYFSPLINFEDSQINFIYQDYSLLSFNTNIVSGNNLSELLVFYIYLILGYDMDTFEAMGGTPYYKKAQNISQLSLASDFLGWNVSDGIKTRSRLIEDLLDPTYQPLRQATYNYHSRGLDQIYDQEVSAKNQIQNSLLSLGSLVKNVNQTYLFDFLLSPKQDEIPDIFSNRGLQPFEAKSDNLIQVLTGLAPRFSKQWSKIKN